MPSLAYTYLQKGRKGHVNETCPGREEMPNYAWTVDEKGEHVLKIKNYTNIQEMINSHYDEVALPVLIKRFMDGDEKALSGAKAHAFYDDITAFPSNMHEAHRLMVEAKNDFNAMSYDDRAYFNNDFNQFMDSIGNGNFLNFLETRANEDLDGDGVIGSPEVKEGEDNE